MRSFVLHTIAVVGCVTVLIAIAGCESGEVNVMADSPARATTRVAGAERLELFSILPTTRTGGGDGRTFHGRPVVGSTVIDDPGERTQILRELARCSANEDGWGFGCYLLPHHGIRAVRNGVTTDFVVCFDCLTTLVYENDKSADDVLISPDLRPVLDAALRRGGVPLSDTTTRQTER